MAWLMLKELKKIRGFESNTPVKPKAYFSEQILRGYSLDKFYSLGFHFVSEKYAVTEFKEVNTAMEKWFPVVHKKLTDTSIADTDKNGNTFQRKAISWLTDHTRLEEQHFASTKQAVAFALDTCSNEFELDRAGNMLIKGAQQFLLIQKQFYESK